MISRPIVLDACVLIGWVKAGDAHHEAALDILACGGEFVVHEVTLAEFLIGPARIGRDTDQVASQVLADLGVRIADESALSSTRRFGALLADTRSETRLKMPDAIVLATALALDGDVATFDGPLHAAALSRGCLYQPHGPTDSRPPEQR